MPTLIRILLILLALIVVGGIALRLLIPRLSPRPTNLGVVDGQLTPCPDSPNCVSTFSQDEAHDISPIPYTVATAAARDTLVATLEAMPRSQLITVEPTYIHAEFRSPTMGYIDDAEFLLDEAAGVIHLRSAARLGQSDLGANRAYMEAIRAQIADTVNP